MTGTAQGLVPAALLVSALALGCDEAQQTAPPPVAPPTASAPIDTTAPGELAEGKERAFGLPIPRDMRIKARLDDTWYAEGPFGLEDVANYVRARVLPSRVDRGPNKTVFVDATLLDDPKKRVQVEVARVHGRVEMVVRDRARLPVEQGLTEEERWRRAGRTRDGKVLREQAE